MNGGATNPNLDCYAWACAKTKMALDVGHKLGGENHVFWGGREGYQSTLNTDAKKELDHLAVRVNWLPQQATRTQNSMSGHLCIVSNI